jgi:hypothetical protein
MNSFFNGLVKERRQLIASGSSIAENGRIDLLSLYLDRQGWLQDRKEWNFV